MQNAQHKYRMLLIAPFLLAISSCNWDSPENLNPPTWIATVDKRLVDIRGQLYFIRSTSEARQLALELGQPRLIFFTAEWCTYCHQMEETTFNSQSISKLSENFVCTLVDADHEPNVCARYAVNSYPTVQFVSANGQPLNRVEGYQTASQLALAMKIACERLAWLDDTQVNTH